MADMDFDAVITSEEELRERYRLPGGTVEKVLIRADHVFVCAGAIYLVLNFAISRGIALLERRLSPRSRAAP